MSSGRKLSSFDTTEFVCVCVCVCVGGRVVANQTMSGHGDEVRPS